MGMGWIETCFSFRLRFRHLFLWFATFSLYERISSSLVDSLLVRWAQLSLTVCCKEITFGFPKRHLRQTDTAFGNKFFKRGISTPRPFQCPHHDCKCGPSATNGHLQAHLKKTTCKQRNLNSTVGSSANFDSDLFECQLP